MTWSENPQRDILEIFAEVARVPHKTRWSGCVRRAEARQLTRKERKRRQRLVLFSPFEAALIRRLAADTRLHKANVGTAKCVKAAALRLQKRGYVVVTREGSRGFLHAKLTKNAQQWLRLRNKRRRWYARRRAHQIEA